MGCQTLLRQLLPEDYPWNPVDIPQTFPQSTVPPELSPGLFAWKSPWKIPQQSPSPDIRHYRLFTMQRNPLEKFPSNLPPQAFPTTDYSPWVCLNLFNMWFYSTPTVRLLPSRSIPFPLPAASWALQPMYCLLILGFLANVNVHVRYMSSSVRLSVCRLSSVTFVHRTQAVEIFGNVSMPFGILAICDLSIKILRRSSQGNPSGERLNQRGAAKYSDFGPFQGYISETVQVKS